MNRDNTSSRSFWTLLGETPVVSPAMSGDFAGCPSYIELPPVSADAVRQELALDPPNAVGLHPTVPTIAEDDLGHQYLCRMAPVLPVEYDDLDF